MRGIPVSGLVVDASCRGYSNSIKEDGYFYGPTEWRVVDIKTKEVLMNSKLYERGNANLGEFGAIIDGLYLLWMNGDKTSPVYTDSKTAMSWFYNRHVKTKFPVREETQLLMDSIKGGLQWVKERQISNPVLLWDNRIAENFADYGRKQSFVD